MWKTKVDKLGRTSIPAVIRKRLGIKENDEVIWILENDRAYILKESSTEIDDAIEWLKKNAPECFVNREIVNEYEKWGMHREWMKKKLGLKQ
mgnify:CR=1 FL=1